MTEAGARPRLSVPLAATLAGLAGFLLFAGTAANDFVFDDVNIVAKNPLAKDPAALGEIFSSHYWKNVSPTGNLYRPLTIWSFAANHALTGPGPAGHHLTNAAIHGAVAALLVLLAARLGLGAMGALSAGLLFALHPIHVEAVAPVVGRSELLAAFFLLAAWLAHAAASWSTPRRAASAWRRWGLIAAAAILYGAGLLSKENAAVLPALLLLADMALAPRGTPRRLGLLSLACMVAVLGIWLVVRNAVIPGLPADDPQGSVFGGVDSPTRLLTATGVLGRYLWLLLFPLQLSADYSYHQIPLISSPFHPLAIGSAVVYIALALAGFYLASRRRLSGVAILVYLGALFPVSNLAFSIGAVMGERLLYLPSVGLCLLVPALFAEIPRTRGAATVRRGAAVLLLLVLSLYAARVIVRNADWKDPYTLFSVTVQTSPESAKAHYNLGVAEEERGDRAAAMAAYRRAIAIKPDMVQALRNYGLDLLHEGRPREALERLRAAAHLDPNIPDLFGDIGIALHQLGRAGEAAAMLRREIEMHPENGRAHYNLATLLLERGDAAEALPLLERAALLDPRNADIHAQIGYALGELNRHDEAQKAFQEALRLDAGLVELLVPLARAALGADRPEVARRALERARRSGMPIPPDLRAGRP